MKNKHLVLLFFLALVIGLLTRKLPWSTAQLFETALVRIDTARVTELSVTLAGSPELSFERTDSAWVATQRNRTVVVAKSQIEPMLSALSPILSIRIVKTKQPDTLGLSDDKQIQLILYKEDKATDKLQIGKEVLENGVPGTYIKLGDHEGIYLVKGHLRGLFFKSIDDFRISSVAKFDPNEVRAIELKWPGSTVLRFEKNDSTGYWMASGDTLPDIQNDSMQLWLNGFQQLNTCRFADNFDESRSAETLFGHITLFCKTEALQFRFFHLLRPDVPEEVPEYPLAPMYLATYFVHSSQNSLNYFALPDTSIARQICFGLRGPSKPSKLSKPF